MNALTELPELKRVLRKFLDQPPARGNANILTIGDGGEHIMGLYLAPENRDGNGGQDNG